MGLYIGRTQVDMFSMQHKKNCVHASARLPSLSSMTAIDVGSAYCLTESYDSYIAGHIYKVTRDGSGLQYEDLNADGAAISAFVKADGTIETR